MISSISSSNSMQRPMQKPSQPLTDTQKETVNDIISKYDSSSISKKDFQTMMTEIKDAGITPSKDLRNILEGSGFEMPEGNGPQGVKGEGRPPKPPELMLDLMNQFESGEISEEDVSVILQNLQNKSGSTTGSIMDEYV